MDVFIHGIGTNVVGWVEGPYEDFAGLHQQQISFQHTSSGEQFGSIQDQLSLHSSLSVDPKPSLVGSLHCLHSKW